MNRMMIRRWIASLVLLPLLTGCIAVDVVQVLDATGTMRVTETYDFTKLASMAEEMGGDGNVSMNKDEIDCNSLQEEIAKKPRDPSQSLPRNLRCEQIKPLVLRITYTTTMKAPAFVRRAANGKTSYTYKLSQLAGDMTSSSSGDSELSDEIGQEMAGEIMQVNFLVTMPGRITSASAGTVTGNSVRITLDDALKAGDTILIRAEGTTPARAATMRTRVRSAASSSSATSRKIRIMWPINSQSSSRALPAPR